MEFVHVKEIDKIKKEKVSNRENKEFIILIMPTFLLLTMFVFLPFLRTLYISLCITDFNGLPRKFIGVNNYIKLFYSSDFLNSLHVTIKYVILNTLISICGALFLALLVDNTKWFSKLFKVSYTIPISISSAAAAVLWSILLNPAVSIINYSLSKIGLYNVGWLTDPKLALISIVMVNSWQNIPFNFIFLLAGLQNISKELYEVASIDGASQLIKLRRIVLPLLTPSLFFVLILNIIDSFQQFTVVNILTRGGPVDTTKVLVYLIYQDAFFNFKFGLACAQSIILFVILLILTLLQFKVVEKKVFYQ